MVPSVLHRQTGVLPSVDPAADVVGVRPAEGAKVFDGTCAPGTHAAMHVDVTIRRNLAQAGGQLTERNEHGARYARLVVLPLLANVDEHGTGVDRLTGGLGTDLDALRHSRQYRCVTERVQASVGLLGS